MKLCQNLLLQAQTGPALPPHAAQLQVYVPAATPCRHLVYVAYSDMEGHGSQRQGEVLLERLRDYVHEQGESTCVIVNCKFIYTGCVLSHHYMPTIGYRHCCYSSCQCLLYRLQVLCDTERPTRSMQFSSRCSARCLPTIVRQTCKYMFGTQC